MPKQVRIQGVIYNVPDNATLEQIQEYVASKGVKPDNSAILAQQQANYPTSAERGGRPGSANTSFLESVINTEPGALGAPNAAEEALMGGASLTGFSPKDLLKLSPKAAFEKLRGLVPSAERAGAKFQTVMGAARDVPVDITKANQALETAQGLEATGSSPIPRVMKKFAQAQKPTTAKFAGTKVAMQPQPMTYESGRQFASNASALSADETMKMAPTMKRQVAAFSNAMKTANREAAAKVGMGELYDEAMKEYSAAKNLAEKIEIGKKWAIRAAIGATAAKIWHDFTE